MGGGIPLGEFSGSTATRELHKTIVEFNAQAEQQTRTMIRLTWAIAVLTFVLVVGLGVQIALQFS